MFTGIITDIGRIASVAPGPVTRMWIDTAYDTDGIALGASIACSGICLTATELRPGGFAVDLSPETLSLTTAGGWQQGTEVNLERALAMGDELGGHLVTGHVDGLAELEASESEADSIQLRFAAPPALQHLIARKGSVCLDGVSLTVNWVEATRFGVTLIPHTLAATTLRHRRPGDQLNIEVDLLARYLARMLEGRG